MSFSSVPKYLGLSEHVATFQLYVIDDLTIVSSMGNRTSTCLIYDSSHHKTSYHFFELAFK